MKTKQKCSDSDKTDGNCHVVANKLHNFVLSHIGRGAYFPDFSSHPEKGHFPSRYQFYFCVSQ
jgi:hypothetical protein